ncbi:hypothetical protein, partial [Delftia tsuruhatensis]|uniref:hypothetical protein n=1 Tax=Delftia tsuruhatensis TaxID=180282 RepID=UPI002447C182
MRGTHDIDWQRGVACAPGDILEQFTLTLPPRRVALCESCQHSGLDGASEVCPVRGIDRSAWRRLSDASFLQMRDLRIRQNLALR